MTEPPGSRRARVELTEIESVVQRGVRRVRWFVRKGVDWIPAAQWEAVEITRTDAGPGVVWERTLTLLLPAGTTLLRLEVHPAPEPPRDPLDYLRREVRQTKRKVRRSEYAITSRGELLPVPVAPPKGAGRAKIKPRSRKTED